MKYRSSKPPAILLGPRARPLLRCCARPARAPTRKEALVAARAGQPQSLDFVRAIVVCRVFSLAFWSQAFAELKARSGSSFVGVVVLAVETGAVVLAVELLAAASPKGRNKKD